MQYLPRVEWSASRPRYLPTFLRQPTASEFFREQVPEIAEDARRLRKGGRKKRKKERPVYRVRATNTQHTYTQFGHGSLECAKVELMFVCCFFRSDFFFFLKLYMARFWPIATTDKRNRVGQQFYIGGPIPGQFGAGTCDSYAKYENVNSANEPNEKMNPKGRQVDRKCLHVNETLMKRELSDRNIKIKASYNPALIR